MRHLPVLSEPHGERRLKYSQQLELYKPGCRVSGGTFSRVRCRGTKGGKGGRGGAHPIRLIELPMKLYRNHLFAPALIKRIVDGGEVMKGTWPIEQRESADERGDEGGCARPHIFQNMHRY